jgi:hypothetical protein
MKLFLRALILILVPAAIAATSTGCLVGSSNRVERSGSYVPDSTFDQIEPGQTGGAWLVATLGQPNDRSRVDNAGTEVWRWTYTEKRDSQGHIFLLFGGSSHKEATSNAFVELKDGVVTKKWRG